MNRTILKIVGALVLATVLLHLVASVLWWVIWNLIPGQLYNTTTNILYLIVSAIAFLAIYLWLQLRRVAWSLVSLGVVVLFVPWVLSVLNSFINSFSNGRPASFFQLAVVFAIILSTSATFLFWKMIPRDRTSLIVLIGGVALNFILSQFRILPGPSFRANFGAFIVNGGIIGFLIWKWMRSDKAIATGSKSEELALPVVGSGEPRPAIGLAPKSAVPVVDDDGWDPEVTKVQSKGESPVSAAPTSRKGKITVTGYVQPGAKGFRLTLDDATGANRQPIEVSIRHLSMDIQFIQDKDHVKVLGKWKKNKYIEARQVKNLTTGIVVERSRLLRKVFGSLGAIAIFVIGILSSVGLNMNSGLAPRFLRRNLIFFDLILVCAATTLAVVVAKRTFRKDS